MNSQYALTSAPYRKIPSTILKLAFAMTIVALAVVPASAGVNGAIFTTNATGTQVNGNLYLSKTDVSLNGGPPSNAPCSAGGLPDGNYYFQVTNPSGSLDLSTPTPSSDAITSREVTVSGGLITAYLGSPATHTTGTGKCVATNPANISVGLAPFNDTDNPGGEYKVWMTPVANYNNCSNQNSKVTFGFCDSDSKTDNFKVQNNTTCNPSTDLTCGGGAPFANLVACKYWDKDDDGLNEGPDTLLSGWVITASTTNGSILIKGVGPSTTGTTDATGCTTFNIRGFPDFTTPVNITLTETQQSGWNQVAPLVGTYNGGTGGDITVTSTSTPPCPNATPPPSPGTVPPCTSTSSVPIIGDGTTTVAPDFGNTGLDLTVAKTATPGFTRTYSWSIAKCAEDPNPTSCVGTPTKVDQVSGTVTFTYKATATETGFNDSGFTVSGTITVTNPNTFDVSGINVTDDDSVNGGTCSVTSGTNVTVSAGKSALFSYTCSYSSNPTGGTNTATATWSSATYPSIPDTSAQGQQAFTFGGPTSTVDPTITITDCFNGTVSLTTGACSGTGSVATTLGTLTATDTTPYATKTFTYTHAVSVPRFGCLTYPNTATILVYNPTTVLGTASASVEVCGPEQTGALTMGFWQNKNGQAIIGGGALTAGVCNSGTWLRLYAPFQDLSSTAKCSAVATYVSNVIKAATCSGTTQPCNAMLKAQMLATALDVYFSDPALGGNKIGAPTAIGGAMIDLTKICKMIDGSGGTATCSGSFEITSSAFGGATSLTVSQLLTYAASQSNAGGSTWYANVKSTQVLAKDTFDAINNQVAFAP
jgi:hypothetical protein